MLTEEVVTLIDGIDKNGNIRVKRVTQIMKDGQPYGPEMYHRSVITKDDDLAGQDADIAEIAAVIRKQKKIKP